MSLFLDLCHLSTPGAIKFSLSVEHEQLEEISSLLHKLVDVLICRRCSEEGLEDITHTLIMLAQRLGTSVRQDISHMLLEGIRKLAVDVTGQIETLMKEAIAYNAAKLREKTDAEGEDHSTEANSETSTSKGILPDRYGLLNLTVSRGIFGNVLSNVDSVVGLQVEKTLCCTSRKERRREARKFIFRA